MSMNKGVKIIAIDTATDYLAFGIYADGKIVFEKTVFAPKRHSEILPNLLKTALSESNLSLSEISHVALSIGPGSYTGLRVGVSFIQGLVFAKPEIKIVGVDTLQAIAFTFAPCEYPIAVAYDAKAGAIYGAIFDAHSLEPTPLLDSKALPPDEFVEMLSKYQKLMLCGDYANKIIPQLEPEKVVLPKIPVTPQARNLIALAIEQIKRNEFIPPEKLEPKYLREFVPKIKSKQKE